MVNVGEYTIHGSYGIGILKEWSVCHICSFKISTWVGWSLLIVRDLYIRGRHLCGICTHIIHNPSNNRKTTRFLSFTAKLDVQLKQFPWEFLLEHNDNPPEKDPQTVRLSWGLWLHNIDFCPKQWMLPIRNTGPIWVFPKIGEPRNGWFIMETLYWNGWFGGYHYFRKHPFEHVNFCLDRNKKQEHFKSAGQPKKTHTTFIGSDFQKYLLGAMFTPFCWWKKSCTTWKKQWEILHINWCRIVFHQPYLPCETGRSPRTFQPFPQCRWREIVMSPTLGMGPRLTPSIFGGTLAPLGN